MKTNPTLAKLCRPRLAGTLRRERLFAQLDVCLDKAALWVCGPPGAGKTTLVASYLDARHLPTLWYQVDAEDIDPASFFHYMGLAAVQNGLTPKVPLPSFMPDYVSELAGFTRRYFRILYENLPRPCALVLDNYQDVSKNAPLHAILNGALTEAPVGIHWITISRTKPPPSCARLRASSKLMELRSNELRLTEEEAGRIATMTLGAKTTDVRMLVEQCNGWAAGLTLLLGEVDIHASPPQPPKSKQALFDYFAEELFNRMPAETQSLLMHTALLPWVRVDWAEALSENDQAGHILESLSQRHFFTHLREGPEPTYQYHALFRDFLENRLHHSLTPSERTQLAHHSAKLLHAGGVTDAALQLYMLAGDINGAAELTVVEAPSLATEGRTQTLERWISILPESTVESTPWLLYWQGICQMNADLAGGRAKLERAYEGFSHAGEQLGAILAASAIIECIHYSLTDLAPTSHWIATLEHLLESPSGALDHAVEINAYASLLQSTLSYPQDARRHGLWIERIKTLLPKVEDVNVKFRVAAVALSVFAFGGSKRDADEFFAQMEPSRNDPLLNPMLLSQYLMPVSLIRQTFYGRTQEALLDYGCGLTIAKQEGLGTLLRIYRFVRPMILIAAGDGAGAKREAALIPKDPTPRAAGTQGWIDAGVALLEGNNEEAIALARYAMDGRAGGVMSELFGSLTLAYAECAGGQYEQALATARTSQNLLARLGGAGSPGDAALPEAFALLQLGHELEAEALLRDRLAIWAREQCPGPMVWVPQVFSPLFAFALERGIEVAYVEQIIRTRQLPPPTAETEIWPWPIRIYTLGRFELLLQGEPLPKSRKAPKKLLMILKALIALGGHEVPDHRLADALWPDQEGPAAQDALTTGLHRLRKLLGDSKAIRVHNGRISLDTGRVWCDAFAFERCAGTDLTTGQLKRIADLYRGSFLQDEYEPAIIAVFRNKMRGKFVRLLEREGIQLEQSREFDAAIALYTHGITAEPVAEALYRGLMRCHQQQRRVDDALIVYEQLVNALAHLRTKPSAATESLCRRLRESRTERRQG